VLQNFWIWRISHLLLSFILNVELVNMWSGVDLWSMAPQQLTAEIYYGAPLHEFFILNIELPNKLIFCHMSLLMDAPDQLRTS
jgi:hypothetical protein